MNQRSRLQRVPRILSRHFTSGQQAKLALDQWRQILRSLLVSLEDQVKYLGHITYGQFDLIRSGVDRFSSQQIALET